MHGLGDSVFTSFTVQSKTRPPTISFCNLIKSSFREWLKGRKNRKLFNSTKRIRYRWFLGDSNVEIIEIKVEKTVKFNERYDTLNYFVLKNNELYCQAFKVGQCKRLSVCDYSATNIIEKVHTQLEHTGNSKIFVNIK